MQYNMQHMKITLDVIPITWAHAKQFWTCTQWRMARWQKKCINRERPWEGIKHTEDKPKELQTRPCRKEGLKSSADMTIYAIDPARLVPTMCHYKLPTTIATLHIWKLHLMSYRLPEPMQNSFGLVLNDAWQDGRRNALTGNDPADKYCWIGYTADLVGTNSAIRADSNCCYYRFSEPFEWKLPYW